jgi:nucleoside-diphosphate-sugar epimerase
MQALRDQKILITGPAGQIAFPLAEELAKENEVWGIARFHHPGTRERVDAAGVTTRVVDLGDPDFTQLPDDFTYVLHLAIFHAPGRDFDQALRVNAEGTGLLMSRFRKARAFLVMSSCAVYSPPDDPSHALAETDPLGGSMQPYSPTYATSKISQEATARLAAREWNLPTTIARMNVAYGPNGGLPCYQFQMMLKGQPIAIQAGRASICNPIHQSDINRQTPAMLSAARVPATIVNWGGDEPVDVETYCRHMGGLAGVEPELQRVDDAIPHASTENTKRRALVGDCRVGWREGMRQMIQACHPELRLHPGI